MPDLGIETYVAIPSATYMGGHIKSILACHGTELSD